MPIFPLKIVHLFNLANTFYDLFHHIISPTDLGTIKDPKCLWLIIKCEIHLERLHIYFTCKKCNRPYLQATRANIHTPNVNIQKHEYVIWKNVCL